MPKPDYIFDFRGGITPITLLKISQIVKEMKAQEIMEIQGLDPDTVQDLCKVLAESSYEILYPKPIDRTGPFQRLRIRKRH